MLHSFTAFTILLVLCELQPVRVGGEAEVGSGFIDADSIAARLSEVSLSLTIRCDEPSKKVGDEVAVTFVIKNEGSAEYEYEDYGVWSEEYQLCVVDQDGRQPYNPIPRGGPIAMTGGYPEKKLAPGESFTKTSAINDWAVLKRPGIYRVSGTYCAWGHSRTTASPAVTFKLEPRTDDEMAAYIEELSVQLAATRDKGRQITVDGRPAFIPDVSREAFTRKLAYTCDRRTAPILIELLCEGGDAGNWANRALCCYLPYDKDIKDALLKAATAHGLSWRIGASLWHYGISHEQIKPLIELSLSPDHPAAWNEGALEAQ